MSIWTSIKRALAPEPKPKPMWLRQVEAEEGLSAVYGAAGAEVIVRACARKAALVSTGLVDGANLMVQLVEAELRRAPSLQNRQEGP